VAILPARQPTFPVLVLLLHRGLEPHLDQTQHIPIDDSLGDTLHQLAVWNRVKGNYDTLPIISTFPKESLSSAFVIRLKVSPLLFGH